MPPSHFAEQAIVVRAACLAALPIFFAVREAALVARCRCHGRRPWRRLSGVLRARRLPLVETGISSIRKRHGGCVTWRPVLKQVLPWRSLSSAAEIDPFRKSRRVGER